MFLSDEKFTMVDFAKKIASDISYFDELEDKRYGTFTPEQIARILERPKDNAKKLQLLHDRLLTNCGILKEILIYKSSMLTYDHFLVADVLKVNKKTKLDKEYPKACKRLKAYRLKYNAPWMMHSLLSAGELFIYIYDDIENGNFDILKIPTELCKITNIKNGIGKYSINIPKLLIYDEDKLNSLPQEFRKIRKKAEDSDITKDKNYHKHWYQITSNQAWGFTINYMETKGLPYYTSMIKDLVKLNKLAKIEDDGAVLSNYKLVVQKLPLNDEGEILCDYDEATGYHEAVKNAVGAGDNVGVGVVTTPYTVSSESLGDNKSKELSYTSNVKERAYDDAGISSEIFNGSRSNNLSVQYGQILDSILPLKLLQMFEVFWNNYMENDKILKNYILYFIDNNRFNKADNIKLAVSSIALWDSRLKYLATLGLEPYEALCILNQEKLMGIDEFMPPMLSSHTATSEDLDQGRPSASESETSDTNQSESQN